MKLFFRINFRVSHFIDLLFNMSSTLGECFRIRLVLTVDKVSVLDEVNLTIISLSNSLKVFSVVTIGYNVNKMPLGKLSK